MLRATHTFRGRHGDEYNPPCRLLDINFARPGPKYLVIFADGEEMWLSDGNLWTRPNLWQRLRGIKPQPEKRTKL